MSGKVKAQISSIVAENEENKQISSQGIKLENDYSNNKPLNLEQLTECKSDKGDSIDCQHDSSTEILKSSLVVEPALLSDDTDTTSSEYIHISKSNVTNCPDVSESTTDETNPAFKEQKKTDKCKSEGVKLKDSHHESEAEVLEASSENFPIKSNSECKSALDDSGIFSRSNGSKSSLLVDCRSRLSDDTDTSPSSQENDLAGSNSTDYTDASEDTSDELYSAFKEEIKQSKKQKSSGKSKNDSVKEGLDSYASLPLKNKEREEDSASSDDTIIYDYMAEIREFWPSLSIEKSEDGSILFTSINPDATDNQSSKRKSDDSGTSQDQSLHVKSENLETRIDRSLESKPEHQQTTKKSKTCNLETIEEKPETVPADELETFRDESVGIRTEISVPEIHDLYCPDSDIEILLVDEPSTSQKRKLSTIYEETAESGKDAKQMAELRKFSPSLSKKKSEEGSMPITSINPDASDNQSSKPKSDDSGISQDQSLHVKSENLETRINRSLESKPEHQQTTKKSKTCNLETIEEKTETVPADELETSRDESVGIRADISVPEKHDLYCPDSDIEILLVDEPSTSQKRKLSTIYEETAESGKDAKRLRSDEETESE